MSDEQKAYIASGAAQTAGARMDILKSGLPLEGRLSAALEALANAQHHFELWLKENKAVEHEVPNL